MKFTLPSKMDYKIILIFFSLIIIGIILFILLGIRTDSTLNSTNNGIVTNIWIEEKNLERLKTNKIRFLFVDIGDISNNGKILTPDNEIKDFLLMIKSFEKKSNYDFILLPYSEVNTLNYDFNEIFKNNLIDEYAKLLRLGFDGAFVDIEPIRFEKREFYLIFLRDLKNNLPKNSIISVYSGSFGNSNNEWEWNVDFFKKVSKYSDLIVVQGYDTGLVTKNDYQKVINNQILEISKNQWNTSFLLAIPSHKPYPELLENAIEIYIANKTDNLIGTSLFAEWTMDENKWKIYEKYLV